jgi:hypothetical protein
MTVVVTANINETLVALGSLPGPVPPVDIPTSFTTKICGIVDEFSIYHWDEFSNKSLCF